MIFRKFDDFFMDWTLANNRSLMAPNAKHLISLSGRWWAPDVIEHYGSLGLKDVSPRLRRQFARAAWRRRAVLVREVINGNKRRTKEADNNLRVLAGIADKVTTVEHLLDAKQVEEYSQSHNSANISEQLSVSTSCMMSSYLGD
jgi:hypothetical protein